MSETQTGIKIVLPTREDKDFVREWILATAEGIVDEFNELTVNVRFHGRNVSVELQAPDRENTGLLVGKEGKMASALRLVFGQLCRNSGFATSTITVLEPRQAA